jgi:hypothetical protein
MATQPPERHGELAQTREQRDVLKCVSWWEWICRLWIIVLGKRKGGRPCVYIPERIINRPDPCIYSQFLLMQLNLPVTWDNPDVAILLNGVEQNTYDLLVDTEYEVVITVHNSSRDKPAPGTRVEVRWIEFGAGAQIRHAITTLTANVPTWPGIDQVFTRWRTPASPGHYCLEVELFHPNDGNPSNNRGWNNTQVKAAASEVRTPVRIFNRWPGECAAIREGGDAVSWWRVLLGYALFGMVAGPILGALNHHHDISRPRQLLLLVAGYFTGALLGLIAESLRAGIGRRRTDNQKGREHISCHHVEITVDSYIFDDKTGKEADPSHMFAGRPPGWPARVEPHTFVFAPNEAFRDVLLIVDAPNPPGPPEIFNVSARQGGVPTGGVTVTVTREEE